MFDTITLKLNNNKANNDFIAETPIYLTDISEYVKGDYVSIKGDLGGLAVTVTREAVKITNSLSKFYFKENLSCLNRRDTREAIENISDLLHLPINKADVLRIDIAGNLIMKHPPELYFRYLGEHKHLRSRLEQPSGLYYTAKAKGKQLIFYDKIAECKAKREPLPEMYKNTNLLRYEIRYIKNLKKQFNLSEITADILSEEFFYNSLKKEWQSNYNSINKIKDIKLNYTMIKSKKILLLQYAFLGIHKAGGELKALNNIKEAQKQGILSKKQAYDLRTAIKQICNNTLLTAKNDLIEELDKKIKQTTIFQN